MKSLSYRDSARPPIRRRFNVSALLARALRFVVMVVLDFAPLVAAALPLVCEPTAPVLIASAVGAVSGVLRFIVGPLPVWFTWPIEAGMAAWRWYERNITRPVVEEHREEVDP